MSSKNSVEKLTPEHLKIGFKLAASIEALLRDLEPYFRNKVPPTSFLDADGASEGAAGIDTLIEILKKLSAQIKSTNFDRDSSKLT